MKQHNLLKYPIIKNLETAIFVKQYAINIFTHQFLLSLYKRVTELEFLAMKILKAVDIYYQSNFLNDSRKSAFKKLNVKSRITVCRALSQSMCAYMWKCMYVEK